jgi:hypothetical protein
MRRLLALVAAAAALAVLFAAPTVARADASQALQNVLSEMRGLSPGDFDKLVSWSRNGTPAPFGTAWQPEQTENDILNLGDDDRRAVLSWLQGNGRYALYRRGATDDQIGPPRPRVDTPAATPTPDPWRNLPLATGSLNGGVQGGIQVLSGFAAAKRDGTSIIACVSFKNVSQKTAKRVVFDFNLTNENGASVGSLTLDRTGEFSPNIDIMSFSSKSDWQNGTIGPRGRIDNCIQKTLGTAALPILQARIAGYSVTEVDYDDGSSWPSKTGGP